MSARSAASCIALALVACLIAGAFTLTRQAEAADRSGQLQSDIDSRRQRERSLAAAATRLGKLERATGRDVELLQRRVAAAQAELERARALVATTTQRLVAAQRRAQRLRTRLSEVRAKLRQLLLSRYQSDRPDLVTVVLSSEGFASLLETMDFLRRIERRDMQLLAIVKDARENAIGQQRRLGRLTQQRRAAAQAEQRRRDAVAGIASGLRARRAQLAAAKAARVAALETTRASRIRAERVLERLLAERREAAGSAGPGGPWAIPWPIVQCESGGQNLPPNSAGASGYYQMLPSTWAGLGGSTPHAFQASKGEQDRLAAKLWAGGAGARNWVCASLVGAA